MQQSAKWLARLPGDPQRASVALAESIGIRAVIKPVTFPFKIWASYKLTVVLKRVTQASRQKGRSAGAAVAAVTALN